MSRDTNSIRSQLETMGAWETLVSLSSEYGVDIDRVLHDRKRLPTACRHHFWRLLRDTLELNPCEIGRVWGADHTTVVLGIRKAESREMP